MNDVKEMVELKNELCKERDLCAELCNIWITRMYQYQTNKMEYNKYLKLIQDTEPYTQELKAKISELNKRICQALGVDSISDTEYTHECTSKYGFDFPKT
jgi:hypothetical protein